MDVLPWKKQHVWAGKAALLGAEKTKALEKTTLLGAERTESLVGAERTKLLEKQQFWVQRGMG